MPYQVLSRNVSFGGTQLRIEHLSSRCASPMRFALYLPPNATHSHPVPVLYWLSGLTCTEENFIQKAGAQRMAAMLGMALVAPDTSPRGDAVADNDNYDLGQGASFYVDAVEPPFAAHFKMHTYIADELPTFIEQHFAVSDKRSISGHSMGGHGALTIGLTYPKRYQSISAFSPIVNPIACPWGQQAFGAYLGKDKATWRQYDSCELISKAQNIPPVLIDQGEHDEFLATQLLTARFAQIAKDNEKNVHYRLQPGYDHSYYFIASFIDEHLTFHAKHLLHQCAK